MSFARALFTVSGLTVLSRVGGFVRDTLTATFVGAGPIADAFFVAQRLPNLFRSLFAEGAFSSAFVPLYTAEHEHHGQEAAQIFAGHALALLLAVLLPFSAIIMLAMPWFIDLLAPGFRDNPLKYKMAIEFSTITFPYLALISVTALQSGVLNAQGRFGPGAAAPIALNVVLIFALFVAHFMHWHMGYTLSWALTLSGVVQMVWLMISCHRAGIKIPLSWPHLTKASKSLFLRIGPGALGAGASQINLLVSTNLASILPTGIVSCLFYADRLNQLPLGIVGIAVATTLLPQLTRDVASGNNTKVRHFTSRSIEFCLTLGIPATIGLAIGAEPIVQVLFEHGKFNHENTLITSQALQAYALGIPAFLLVKVFAASFFARHDTKTPVIIAFIAMFTNVLFSIGMIGPLHHIGIALANTLAVWLNAALLLWSLKKKQGVIGDSKLQKTLPLLILPSLGMGSMTYLLVFLTKGWFITGGLSQEILALSIIIGFSSVLYGLLLHITGAIRLHDILTILKRQPID